MGNRGFLQSNRHQFPLQRILPGAIQIRSGDTTLLITERWTKETHQGFLSMIRAHWRGGNIVLFEDRASQHTAPDSRDWAAELGIEIRLLPRATSELNAMDHIWRHAKRETVGSRATLSVDDAALHACQYILDLTPRERLRKAGVLSGNFWLTK
jgi:hypothetical protein